MVIVVLGLLLVALLAVAIFLILRLRKPGPKAAVTPPVGTAATQTTPAAAIPNPLAPAVVQAPAGRTAAAQIAELFAERYGSYSNQGSYQNLQDLLPVMTPRYRTETQAYLASVPPSSGTAYEGVTSQKISTDVRTFDDAAGTAVIAVMLQQQKAVGNSAGAAVSYRSLKMTLKKIGKEWKVDSAAWEN